MAVFCQRILAAVLSPPARIARCFAGFISHRTTSDTAITSCQAVIAIAPSLEAARTPELWVTKQVVSVRFPDLSEAFTFVQSLCSGIHFVNLKHRSMASLCRLFNHPTEDGGTDALTLTIRSNFHEL